MLKDKYTSCLACGCQVTYKTNARVYCGDCRLRVMREKARIGAEKRRRSSGVKQAKGLAKTCCDCGSVITTANKQHKRCAPCKLEHEREAARKRSRLVPLVPELRERHYAWKAKQRRTPKGKIDSHMRTLMGRALKQHKVGRSWKSLVPYAWQELKAHIEAQFQPGMTWENHGEWHLDHIRPRASFNYTTPEDPEFQQCWAMENLQPLWALDNIRKGAKMPETL